jgi:hypothetical protein
LKDRAKCASETQLTAASRRTGQSSCEAASILSLARSKRRNREGPLPPSPFGIAPCCQRKPRSASLTPRRRWQRKKRADDRVLTAGCLLLW